MPTAAEYLRWFDYEKDAHAKSLRSLESVPLERRTGPEFQRAQAIFGHIIAAHTVWLSRLGAIDAPTGMFPAGVELTKLAADLQAVERHWDEYLSRLSEEELNRFAQYQSYDAGAFRTRIADILTQLFGHSWYHRGQIAMLVKAAGGEPAVTDFIYWCREPIA